MAKLKEVSNAKKYDTAITIADAVLKLARENKDHKNTITAMRLKGKALFGKKKEKESVDLYFAALALCSPPQDNKEIALLYGEIGYAYFIQGHHQESKGYYRKEIAILKKLQGQDSVGNQLINISVMHQQLGEFDSARIVLDEVKDILSRYPDSSMKAYYLFNMGAYYTAINQPDTAKKYYLEAYDIWKALNNQSQLFKISFNLGYYSYQKKDYKEALRYYYQSVASAEKFGNKRDIAHVYGTMAESFAALNDFRNAYKYLYLYATLNDSFSNEDINSYVLKLDKQYQTEKSRQTIQTQELELKTANLAMQQQRNTILIIIIVFVLVLAAGAVVFVYTTFRNRVRTQVEEAKGRFFANVAHEIRTPLSMIKGPIEVLQQKTTDPAMLQQLDIAARNTQRLNDLIAQMLDIAKIDAASYTLHQSVGSIDEFATQLFGQYRLMAAEKNITLSCQCDAATGNTLFDRDALEKIVNNLAGNAIKYTPSGGTAGVEINTTNASADTLTLNITVWDSGPGIPALEQEKIFDRFYRSDAQQQAGVMGIGIGLSLTRELVHLLNGTITIASEAGKGAVFTVTCSLQRAAAATGNTDITDPQAEVILLVEDDNDILQFNKALLQEEGYHVLTATNGAEAATLLSATLPDLVITDLMMPQKDGLELLKEIRNNMAYAHLPVIILSAKASLQSRTNTIAEGAQAYLPKPFSPAELKGLVRNQLELLRRQKATYQTATTDEQKDLEARFSGTDPFTQKCYDIIHEHLDDPQLSVEMLAGLMNINRSHFQRKIKTLTGYSPSELIKTIRLEKAREMLLKKEGNITETAYATGFTSQSYFTRCFSEHFGYPPSHTGEKP